LGAQAPKVPQSLKSPVSSFRRGTGLSREAQIDCFADQAFGLSMSGRFVAQHFPFARRLSPPWKLCFMPLWNMSKARPVEDSVGLKRLVRFAAHIEEQTMCKARFVNAAQKLLQWEGCTR